jgi:hypothetical protein
LLSELFPPFGEEMHMLKVISFTILTLFPMTLYAANWFALNNVVTTKTVFFFDLDTVVKNGDQVTIWTKYVNDTNSPDSDGSYSTAQKVTYFCRNRTAQALSTSIYDQYGQFMRSNDIPSPITDIVPGSIGESIWKIVCKSSFPKNEAGGDYYRVKDNDIFAYTKVYFDYLRARNNDPAPK